MKTVSVIQKFEQNSVNLARYPFSVLEQNPVFCITAEVLSSQSIREILKRDDCSILARST